MDMDMDMDMDMGMGMGMGMAQPLPNSFDLAAHAGRRADARERRRAERRDTLDERQIRYDEYGRGGGGGGAALRPPGTAQPPRHVRERRDRAPAPYRTFEQQHGHGSGSGGSGGIRTPHVAAQGHTYHPLHHPSSHTQAHLQPHYLHQRPDAAAPGVRPDRGAYQPDMYYHQGHAPSPITYHANESYENESLFGQNYGGGTGRTGRRRTSGIPAGAASGGGDGGESARGTDGIRPFGFSFSHNHTNNTANRSNHNPVGGHVDDPAGLGGIFVREQSFFTPGMGSTGAFRITTTGGGSGHVGFGVHGFRVTDNVNAIRSMGSPRAGVPDAATDEPRPPPVNPDFISVFDTVFTNLFGAMNPHLGDDMANRNAEDAVPGLQPFFAQALTNMGLMGTFFNDEDRSYEEWQQLVDRMGNASRGATEEEISRLPTESFSLPKKSARLDPSAVSASSTSTSPSRPDEEPEKCPICLGEYEDGDEIKRLPCLHKFCNPCISRWLQTSKECPCCKASIREPSRAHASC
jgi:E3 ubiquitin-protein ligase Arkadia